jgi:hypothetical protein
MSLRRLDEYSLNQILDAVKPTPDQKKEIKRQFFNLVNNGELETGFGSILGRSTAMEALTSGAFSLGSGIQAALKINQSHAFPVGNGLRRILDDLVDFLVTGHLQVTREKLFIGLFWCGLKTRNAVNDSFTAFLILIIGYLAES